MAEQEQRIGARLRQLRIDVGHPTRPGRPLPVEDAADRAGIRPRQWQRWEKGETQPRTRNLEKLAQAFGLDVAEFYIPDEEPELEESQLDRVERKLDRLLALFSGEPASEPGPGGVVARAGAPLLEVAESRTPRAPARSASRRAGARRKPA